MYICSVKDLCRYIERLLLTHDCVIIPQFGAFITNYMSSQWSQDEQLFIPPYRTVHFNADICYHDTLLQRSLEKDYGISAQEAQNWCTDFVAYIQEQLQENGSMDFGSIGVFTQDEGTKELTFSPCIAGVTTPIYYGLDTVQIDPIPHQLVHRQDEIEQAKQKVVADDKHLVIRINRHVANYAAAIAATIVLFFTFSTQVTNTNVTGIQQTADTEFFMPANLVPTSTTHPAAAVITKAAPKQEQQNTTVQTIETETPAPQPVAPQPEKKEAKPAGVYAVVLASAITQTNAESYVQNLKKRGYNAEILMKGKMRRVVIAGFETEADAHAQIAKMRSDSQEFASAWMMKTE